MNKKKVKKKNNFSFYKLISIIIVLFVLLLLIIPNNNIKNMKTVNPTNVQIILKLKNNTNPQLKGFSTILDSQNPIIVTITPNNISELSSRYSFVFAKSIESDYGYKVATIDDYLIIYPNLVVVYNYKSDLVKSLFKVQTVGN